MGQDQVRDKVVLVTGAGKGTGRAVAQAFAAAGALVAVNDISPVNLDQTVANILAASGRVKPYVSDITRKLPIQGLLNQVLDDLGGLHILVHCAEVEPQKPLLDMDEWDWDRTLDVNLSSAFLLTQSAARIMIAKGQGGFIFHVGQRTKSDLHRAAYFASKAGLESLVNSARHEMRHHGLHIHLFPAGETTPQEIVEYCSSPTPLPPPPTLIDGLRAAPSELRQALQTPLVEAHTSPPADGDWNTHQVLTHLRDVNQQVYLPRLHQVVERSNPLFAEFDGDQWMMAHYDPAGSTEDLLTELASQYNDISYFLASLPASTWQRPGTHVSLGPHTLQWWADRMLSHFEQHLPQLSGA